MFDGRASTVFLIDTLHRVGVRKYGAVIAMLGVIYANKTAVVRAAIFRLRRRFFSVKRGRYGTQPFYRSKVRRP